MTLQNRRTIAKVYFDILEAIELHPNPKLTHIQLVSNVSYDKLKKHVKMLKKLGMIQLKPAIKVTLKGIGYMQEFGEYNTQIQNISDAYLDPDSEYTQSRETITEYFLRAQGKSIENDTDRLFEAISESKDTIIKNYKKLQTVKIQK